MPVRGATWVIYWMLRLIPVEREIARQAEVKRQRRQEYLAELRVKNEATKKVREEREREDKKRRDREYREWYQTLSDEAKREEDRIEAARYRALQKAKVQRKYGVTLND